MRELTCEQCQEAMSACLDSETTRRELSAVQAHLAVCPSCRSRFDAEREVRDLLRSRSDCLRVPPGPDLKRRVLSSVRSEHVRRFQRGARFPRWAAMFAVAASIALVAFAGLYRYYPGTSHRSLVGDLVDEHIRCMMKREAALDLVTNDADSLRAWFRGRLDANVDIPDLAAEGLALAGGRLCYLVDRRAAYLMYRAENGHLVCLFILDATGLEDEVAGGAGEDEHKALLTTRKGYSVAVWEDSGLVHALVADVSCPNLERLATVAGQG